MRKRLPGLTLTSLVLVGCSSDPQAPPADAQPPAAESRQTPATAALAATPKVQPSALVVPPPRASSPKTAERTQAASPAPPAPTSVTPDKPAAAEVKAPPHQRLEPAEAVGDAGLEEDPAGLALVQKGLGSSSHVLKVGQGLV